MPSLKEKKHYDYSDYCSWDDSERWELIEGIPYAMSPAPLEFHQRISGELYFQLKSFLIGKYCNVYYAPFDVRLNADQEDNTVVQPDLVVICDFTKVDRKGCKGAPDLVIEILSDSTAQRDLFVKLNLYLKAGVREYWIIDPATESLLVYTPNNGSYIATHYVKSDMVPVYVLPGCEISLQMVFGSGDLSTHQ